MDDLASRIAHLASRIPYPNFYFIMGLAPPSPYSEQNLNLYPSSLIRSPTSRLRPPVFYRTSHIPYLESRISHLMSNIQYRNDFRQLHRSLRDDISHPNSRFPRQLGRSLQDDMDDMASRIPHPLSILFTTAKRFINDSL